jgi:3-oxoadipate enol-lactonase
VSRPQLPDETLAGVACPILLMSGDRDEPTRQQQGRRFAQLNAQARYVEIGGAAHAAHQKCPDTVRQVIGEFLAEVEIERVGNDGAVN